MLDAEDADYNAVPEEELNRNLPQGMPPHALKVKVGMPLILLRNLDPSRGLCNGTRMRLKRVLGRFAIEVKVETEDGGRRVDVIPRIKMQPKDDEYPYGWTRTQFPVRIGWWIWLRKMLLE